MLTLFKTTIIAAAALLAQLFWHSNNTKWNDEAEKWSRT